MTTPAKSLILLVALESTIQCKDESTSTSAKSLILLVALVAFQVAFYPMQLVAVDPLLLKGGVKQLASQNSGIASQLPNGASHGTNQNQAPATIRPEQADT